MSEREWKRLIVTHGDLRKVFRRLTTRHLRLLEAEAMKPDSPVHDKEKYVHINQDWQTGRVSEVLRVGAPSRGCGRRVFSGVWASRFINGVLPRARRAGFRRLGAPEYFVGRGRVEAGDRSAWRHGSIT